MSAKFIQYYIIFKLISHQDKMYNYLTIDNANIKAYHKSYIHYPELRLRTRFWTRYFRLKNRKRSQNQLVLSYYDFKNEASHDWSQNNILNLPVTTHLRLVKTPTMSKID